MSAPPGRVTVKDVETVIADAVGALSSRLSTDWRRPVPGSDWTGWEVVEHLADSLFFYAGQLVPVPDAIAGGYPYDYRAKRDGGPEGIMFAHADAGQTGLVRVLVACGGLLVAALRTAPANHRAHHMWGRSDPEGFAAMALAETLTHIDDIAPVIGIDWSPDSALCSRVLQRLFPDAPTDTEPLTTLRWATGRGDLAGHAPQGAEWRWFSEPRSGAAPEGTWTDAEYLRSSQYATSSNLGNRSNLHDRYGTSPVPFREWEARLVAWPADGADVLEVGSGPGRFWESAHLPRSLRLTVTDISDGMAAEAANRLGPLGYASLRTQACDVQHLPFDDDSFDVIVANHMMYHVPDPVAALREFRRVLRPDGVAVIATNGSRHMWQLNDIIAEVLGRRSDTVGASFDIDSGEAALRNVFGSITWHTFANPLMVTDPRDAFAYATSFPPGESATEEQRHALLARFSHEVAASEHGFRIDTRTGAFICSGSQSGA